MFIPAPHGQLEAVFREPASPPIAAALVCHPHPQFGGTMHTKAVFRAAQALNEVGCATLRFNFRGVGTSTGSWDEGIGETEDARVALDYLAEQAPELSLIAAGFSFGSRIALQIGIPDRRVSALVGLGIPLKRGGFEFLTAVPKPLLLVQGEEDEFGPGAEVAQFVGELGPHATLARIPDSDHYFTGHEEELKSEIRDWVTANQAHL